ncbi:ATP-binding protein [Acanthopleuribacter pedis]|uniref:histidine kinase n=1 Tax=Acanthopleuribacter pedis TaxID=442870 RepID=A0A8J7U252_9BACT|nr:ATP-binding protein [Acanthopleuribacter pedis]MBO1318903.1 response regulator [Acanthopleuribacter pedis]
MLFSFLFAAPLPAQQKHIRLERFSLENGLSQSTVQTIFQDRRGYMWFGTQDGLNRFDGYRFTIFKRSQAEAGGLIDNWITALEEDEQGRLWIGTDAGLCYFDERLEQFTPVPLRNSHFVAEPRVTALQADRDGGLWIATQEAGLAYLRPKSDSLLFYRRQSLDPDSLPSDSISSLLLDEDHGLWVGTPAGLALLDEDRTGFQVVVPEATLGGGVNALARLPDGNLILGTEGAGLFRFYPELGKGEPLPINLAPARQGLNRVRALAVGHPHDLWVGTFDGLINLNLATGKSRVFRHDPTEATSLCHDVVWSLQIDRGGLLWVGTFSGLNKHNPESRAFNHYRFLAARDADSTSAQINRIRAPAVDPDAPDAVLWVGTDTGLLRFDRENDQVKRFVADPNRAGALSSGRVSDLLFDPEGLLLIGTIGGGLNVLDREKGVFRAFRHDPNDVRSISSDRIRGLFSDKNGVFWICTDKGLNQFDRETERFLRLTHRPDQPNSLAGDFVWRMVQDWQDRYWVATFSGLTHMSADTKRFVNYHHEPGDPASISHNRIFSVYVDSGRKVLWLGTLGGGLNRFDPETGKAVRYNESHGMANDVVYGILEDDEHYLWMSTNLGISRFDPETQVFRNYRAQDGLQNNEFNNTAYARLPSGELFFGGINGFNLFQPTDIRDNPLAPPVVLTRFLRYNQEVPLRRQSEASPLLLPIDHMKSLNLDYEDGVFSFEFAALDYADPTQNKYAYMLEGLDESWIYTDASRRFATYTNLDPGSYRFRVIAGNRDGVWNRTGKSIPIHIAPPWWRSYPAQILYIVVLLSLLALLYQNQRRKLALARALSDRQRQINESLLQVNALKDQFLANTSHELRTPLNGIIGLAETLRDGVAGPLPAEANKQLGTIVAFGRRLSNLVNDILDFAKLRHHQLELNCQPVDLHVLVDQVFQVAAPLINRKKIKLINNVSPRTPLIWGDEQRLEQVLFNLIGNAVKFTDEGRIEVGAEIRKNFLTLSVADTGVGIADADQKRIFESFEQLSMPENGGQGGTGLGLAICREIVERHGGTIWVDSSPGAGSTFSFSLPLKPVVTQRSQPVAAAVPASTQPDGSDPHIPLPTPAEQGGGRRGRILIIDDEPVNRQVLGSHLLLAGYEIEELANGQDTLARFNLNHEDIPPETREAPDVDLIILDIMMPGISGYEVCRQIRKVHPEQDLPILFLSARNQAKDLATGFDAGGSDYLNKPIIKSELLARVKHHLSLLEGSRLLESKVRTRTAELRETLLKLVEAQRRLLDQAHDAGMAEMAANLMHQVGNNLNNMVSSAEQVVLLAGGDEPVHLLRRLHGLLEQHRDDLGTFMSEDPRGRKFPDALRQLAEHLDEWREEIHGESTQLATQVDRLGEVLRAQEQFLQVPRFKTQTDINQIVSEMLEMEETYFKNQGIFVRSSLNPVPALSLEKPRLCHVLLFVLKNAAEALLQHASLSTRWISVETKREENGCVITVEDNGIGMDAEQLQHIYQEGYSTKENHLGFGLHYCGNTMQELGGRIEIFSPGVERGARVRLWLPVDDGADEGTLDEEQRLHEDGPPVARPVRRNKARENTPEHQPAEIGNP